MAQGVPKELETKLGCFIFGRQRRCLFQTCVTSNGLNLNSSSLARTSDYRIFLHIDTPLICLFISYFTPKYTHSMDKYTANSALLFTTNKPTKVKQSRNLLLCLENVTFLKLYCTVCVCSTHLRNVLCVVLLLLLEMFHTKTTNGSVQL